MQHKITLKLAELTRRSQEGTKQIETTSANQEEPNNDFFLMAAQHVGDLKALALELEEEILQETAERRIDGSDMARRLHTSKATISRRWRDIRKER